MVSDAARLLYYEGRKYVWSEMICIYLSLDVEVKESGFHVTACKMAYRDEKYECILSLVKFTEIQLRHNRCTPRSRK